MVLPALLHGCVGRSILLLASHTSGTSLCYRRSRYLGQHQGWLADPLGEAGERVCDVAFYIRNQYRRHRLDCDPCNYDVAAVLRTAALIYADIGWRILNLWVDQLDLLGWRDLDLGDGGCQHRRDLLLWLLDFDLPPADWARVRWGFG